VSKLFIPKIEFYITNVCNLACNECNRFNDLKFSGTQLWKDYEAVYEEWAEHIEFEKIVILGGEPLLNPSVLEWIKGLHRLWPKYAKQLLTNATMLDRVKGLYETCLNNNTWIGISLHSAKDLLEIEERIKRFFGNNIAEKIEGKENNRLDADWYYRSNDGVQVGIWKQDYFYKNSILNAPSGEMFLHDSDPKVAHDQCTFVKNKNYHFIRGRIYKCGPSALFPELAEQFNLNLSDEDKQLVNSYKPLTIEMVRNGAGQDWLDHIDDQIPQCKFCPEHYSGQAIDFEVLKQKIRKS
jgi:organic radical activating enzyme